MTSTEDRDVVIAAPVRTPIGRFGGGLSSLGAAAMGAMAGRESLQRAGVDAADLDEVIFGCARQAGQGPNVARQVAWRCGTGPGVPAFTVNKACGSGLKAIALAAQAIRASDASLILAGGTESMSRVPHYVEARWGIRLGDAPLVDGMYRDGFLCPLCHQVMGATAETLADRYHIPRQEQDAWAAMSQNRAEAARREGRFASEIVPVEVEGRKGATETIVADEHPRDGVTPEGLAKLPPVFREGGTVHAGNSSGITDGAASVLVTTLAQARRRRVTGPLFRLVGTATAGVEPEIMGIGPVPAVKKLMQATGTSLTDVDLIELNEAFAAQVLACVKDLAIDVNRLNVNGGSIALGHPIGASGARIVVTLLHEMARRSSRLGIATLCISGGMGIAALFERIEA